MALTKIERLFARAKHFGGDQITNKEAAIKAGSSEKTAAAAGSRLAKNPKVIKHIERLERAAAKKAQYPDKGKSKSKKSQAEDEKASEKKPAGFTDDPLEIATRLMNDEGEDPKFRLEAAKFVQEERRKKLEPQPLAKPTGKKAQQGQAAKFAGQGKYGAGKPPLQVVK